MAFEDGLLCIHAVEPGRDEAAPKWALAGDGLTDGLDHAPRPGATILLDGIEGGVQICVANPACQRVEEGEQEFRRGQGERAEPDNVKRCCAGFVDCGL